MCEDIGAMLYYGESEFDKIDYGKLANNQINLSNEIRYAPYLLQNIILGLSCIQNKGNMVIKLYEIETQFTAGLVYILYFLFESILVAKPFISSAVKSGQYVVCKGMKDNELT